jgi:hypothetical protein
MDRFSDFENRLTFISRTNSLPSNGSDLLAPVFSVCRFEFSFNENGMQCHPTILCKDEAECHDYFTQSVHDRSVLVEFNQQVLPYREYMRIVIIPCGGGQQSLGIVIRDITYLCLCEEKHIGHITRHFKHKINCFVDGIDASDPVVHLNDAVAYFMKTTSLKNAKPQRKLVHMCLSNVFIEMLGNIHNFHMRQSLQGSRLMLQESEDNRRLISNQVMLLYMDELNKLPARNMVTHCHRQHNTLVNSLLIGLQGALHDCLQTSGREEQKQQACHFLETIFNAEPSEEMNRALTTQLSYKLVMYSLIKSIMIRNNLTCSPSHGEEPSTHAPLPLLALIMWRVEDLRIANLDYPTHTGGIFHQLKVFTHAVGKDRNELEIAYNMNEESNKIRYFQSEHGMERRRHEKQERRKRQRQERQERRRQERHQRQRQEREERQIQERQERQRQERQDRHERGHIRIEIPLNQRLIIDYF